MSQDDVARRRQRFRALHEQGCFVMPNPWDPGTVRVMEQLGFPALGSTSAGFGFARGRPDEVDGLPLELVLGHLRELVATATVPVSADFQAGFAADAEGVAVNVRRALATGIAGLSIEDATGDAERPLRPVDEAAERVAAARAAIDAEGAGAVLTARTECLLVGGEGALSDAVLRLRAYREAGADVLYAPGLTTTDQVRAVVEAAEGTPVNVLVSGAVAWTIDDLRALGVRRISLGSTLARVAWGALLSAMTPMVAEGSFAGLAPAAPFADLNALFAGPENP